MKEFWINPFTAETGVAVEYVNGPDLAKVNAQIQSNNIQWDVLDAAGAMAYAGEKEGLWEAVDTKLIDPARFVRKPPSFAVPTAVYTGGVGYDPSRNERPPKDFAQLWDIKNFPGRRALPRIVDEVLELALLADGVTPSKLYPLDVDRAFKALDRIKPYVKVWFDATARGLAHSDE
ncbi:extracellular solute-binding protein [Bradyrhizobium sp. 4]|nr:extracellular solute-binding protein [Bradyrhizobium sp. 39]MCK1749247.1 extracellular solute-binding protein [Bradyrhizobium sp. 135]UPJ38651.1 extracellular solute-binding protein [Bradyrhizobium sp. 4]